MERRSHRIRSSKKGLGWRARWPHASTPSKIVCVGRNYLEHARELGNELPKEPLIFLKPPSSLITDGEAIVLPELSRQVEHEGEIGLVIGTRLRRARREDASRAIRGIVAANDVTARDLQRSDPQWTRAKGFDTFCPVGEEAQPPRDLRDLEVVTRVNGQERHVAGGDLAFAPTILASFRVMTLDLATLLTAVLLAWET